MMEEIILETSDGSFVSNALMLPFGDLPEVVFWGTRVFSLHDTKGRGGARCVYRECFSVAVFTESQYEDQGQHLEIKRAGEPT